MADVCYGRIRGPFAVCSVRALCYSKTEKPKNREPDAITAASGGSLLFDRYRPFAILKPKNRKRRLLCDFVLLMLVL